MLREGVLINPQSTICTIEERPPSNEAHLICCVSFLCWGLRGSLDFFFFINFLLGKVSYLVGSFFFGFSYDIFVLSLLWRD